MNPEKSYSTQFIVLAQILVFASLLGLWEGAVRSGVASASLYGQPTQIAHSLWVECFQTGRIWFELWWTISSTMLAFAIGACAALVLGMVFVVYPLAERVLDPLFSALNAMPRIALAPLLILWFGLGIGSKVAIGASLCFFIVLQTVVAGGRSVDRDHLTLAATVGLKPTQLFWKITMPSAVPVVFGGLRLGFMYSLLGVVAGEIIASEHGLGQLTAYLTSSFDINGVWAVVFILALVGVTLSWTLLTLERTLLRWR
ncbi:NitT/TauT family transport system permease protein [Bradyrhizobium sp. AZCC 1588]|uniref:ABC transporter permease n=1 Tax=unclassified Bradyrhizobium TaxID=2631580 RepID=UPI002FF196DC